jgi:hypothetical protein
MVVPQGREESKGARKISLLRELQCPQQFRLRAQRTRGMQQKKGSDKTPRQWVALLTGEFRRFRYSDSGHKQKRQPRSTADKPRSVGIHEPRNASYQKHRQGSQPPDARRTAAPQRFREQDQRGNAGDEKQDVIEIEHCGIENGAKSLLEDKPDAGCES